MSLPGPERSFKVRCYKKTIMTREMTLRDRLSNNQPDLVVDLYLYPTDAGGKTKPIMLGYGCPCSKDTSCTEAWDGYPLLEEVMWPGERRRVGFLFLSGSKAIEAFESSKMFYLWEGRLVGEATLVR